MDDHDWGALDTQNFISAWSSAGNKLVDLTEQNLGTNHRLFGKALAGSLRHALEVGDSERASELMGKANSFLNPKTSEPELLMLFLPLQGRGQMMQGQFFAAETSFRTALSELETNASSNNQFGAAIYVGLADAYRVDSKYSEAEAAYQTPRTSAAVSRRFAQPPCTDCRRGL